MESWASYAHRKPQYGHLTSNIQELVNSHWLPARRLPTVHGIILIWTDLMEKYFQRRTKHQVINRITNYARTQLDNAKNESGNYKVHLPYSKLKTH